MKSKIKYVLLLGLIALLFVFVGCDKNKIDAPTNLTIDEENNLIWDSVEEAKTYTISFYSVDTNTTTTESTRKTNYNLSNLTEGDYEISICANAGDKDKKDSNFSEVLYFHKYYETGCVYTLINNNTEYQVTRYGKATGDIVIEDIYRSKAVTKIAEGCFKGSTRVTGVTIGNNVISIGENAFYNCSKLEFVNIPTSVREMGKACFQSCRNLKEVNIPYGVNEIPSFAFAYCRALTKATIGQYTTILNESCFQSCSALLEFNIPDSVTEVGPYAFAENSSLKKVTIGKGVTTLSTHAFFKNTSLEEVIYNQGSNLSKVESYCFGECSSLKNMVFPDGLETIGAYCFYASTNLEAVDIPNSVYSLGNSAFNQTKLYLDQVGLDFIYADDWLIACSSEVQSTLTEINTATLKNTIVGIADNTFRKCENLEIVCLPASFKYIGAYAFAECNHLWKFTTLDDSIESIGEYAFAACALTNVSFGIGLKKIGKYAFYSNTGLDNNALHATSWIPETVTQIGTYAFMNTMLWNKPRDNDGIIYASNWVVGYTGTAHSIELKFDTSMVAGIGDYAFYKNESITSITGLNNCRYIGKGAFFKCSSLASVSLNRNLTEIREETFYGCSNLIKITMPRTLKRIDKYAFFKCTLISSVDLLSTNCENIGYGAFYSCSNIQELTLSKSLKTIGDLAFYKCESIKSVELPDKVESIGNRAFYKCLLLSDLKLNEGLKTIGIGAFNSCSALKEINITNSVETIGKNAFYMCANVETLNLGSSITMIDDYAFYGLNLVKELELPKSLTYLGNYVFKGLASLKTLVLPYTVEIVGQHCFYGCSNLTIYTDAISIQPEWHNRFNSTYRPMFWGVELDENQNVLSVIVSKEKFVNGHASNGVNAPKMDGKTFKNWIDDSSTDNTTKYSMEDLINIDKECKLKAQYE